MAAKGKRQLILTKRMAASSLLIATLATTLSFEMVSAQSSQPACYRPQPQTCGILQMWDAAKQRALDSYDALRFAYRLQRSVNELEKQEADALREKSSARRTVNSATNRDDL